MFEDIIQPLIDWLSVNPHWAGAITFFIAFIESLAIVGTIIPGSVTMTAIGVLIGTGIIPLESTVLWAIIGAIAGDSASFYIGYYFNDRLRTAWPFSKWPTLLTRGETFFKTHGGKSVFIGRFTGPLRPIIPVIAGMLNMSRSRFMLANILSAIGWAALYILPGVLIGTAAIDLNKEAATNMLLVVLVVLVSIWLIIWLIKILTHWGFYYANKCLLRLWMICQNKDTNEPNAHLKLGRLIFLFLTVFTFILVCISIQQQSWVTGINANLFTLLQSIRNELLDKLITGYSMIGSRSIIIVFINIIFIYFISQRKWQLAWLWLFHGILTILLIYGLKLYIDSPRPDGFHNIRATASFPSGHVGLYASIIGFFIFLVSYGQKELFRQQLYIGFCTTLVLLCFSRLYLGAHWFSDIIGSLLLSSSLLLLSMMIYRKLSIVNLKTKQLMLFGGITLSSLWLMYFIFKFQEELQGYQPII